MKSWSLPSFSVRRPIFTTMVTLIVMLLGVISLTRLPIDLLPEIELPTVTVSSTYANASPEEMEILVTRPIEQAISAVPGVEEMVSTSAEGISNVTIRFAWGENLDAATNDVRDRVDRVMRNLPDDVDRPNIRRFDPSNFPIVLLGVSSPLSPIELTLIIEEEIRNRLESINGVAVVDIWGGFDREIQVNLEPERMTALDLDTEQVLGAIRTANLDVPVGQIEVGNLEIRLDVPGDLPDLDTLADVVVDRRDGQSIRLSQVATIEDTHQRLTRIVRVNGEQGVRLAIRKQSGANTVAVARDVMAEVERIRRDYPRIQMVPVINSADYIQRSIDNVVRSIMYGGSLALLILLLFLRNIRSSLVVMISIPISIIATFTLIYFYGFTLNLMTLGGLALGVGLMVDNAIVVLENIFRHRDELSESAEESAVAGTGEVTSAITASTITTMAIFLPLIFIAGSAGVLFRQLAIIIAFALVCSLAAALTMVPMLASRLILPATQRDRRRPRLVRRMVDGVGRGLTIIEETYQTLVRGVVRVPWLVVIGAVAVLGGSVLLSPWIGTEFMPPTDEGEVRVAGEMEVGTRLDVVDQQMLIVEEIVEGLVTERVAMVSSVGPSGWRPTAGATGDLRLSLVPVRDRDESNEQIASRLRSALEGSIEGMTIRVRSPQGLFILNRVLGGDEGLAVEIRGFDFQVLDQLAREVIDAVQDIPGVTDVRAGREAGVPLQLLRIDRDKAADLGLTVEQVARTLETSVGGSRAGDFRDRGNEYRILVRLRDAEQRSLDEILDLTMTNRSGERITLRNVVSVEESRGPTLIDRKNQQRLNTVSINTSGRDLGSIARDIEDRLARIPQPAGYDLVVAGDYEQQQEAFAELMISLLLSILLVYMVMACLYESLIDPLVVMFSVPMAGIGVILALFLTGSTMNVQSFIGCIMLGGIVVNNAILIVDQSTRLRRDEGMSVRDAVTEAGRRRLRPILMTTLTTILALLPLAMGIGEGAEAQAPLARAVIGGLLASTAITLLLIPAVYRIFHPERQTTS
ncbi:MAG: efflux RND transporter permease subunit [Phycisphaeraceae bacterium]|nr:efflux RND transporter permease subunit [Phycisphaeraceae bacterium]